MNFYERVSCNLNKSGEKTWVPYLLICRMTFYNLFHVFLYLPFRLMLFMGFKGTPAFIYKIGVTDNPNSNKFREAPGDLIHLDLPEIGTISGLCDYTN